jgi:hypothetical protein
MPESVAKTMNPEKLASLQRRYRTQKTSSFPAQHALGHDRLLHRPGEGHGINGREPARRHGCEPGDARRSVGLHGDRRSREALRVHLQRGVRQVRTAGTSSRREIPSCKAITRSQHGSLTSLKPGGMTSRIPTSTRRCRAACTRCAARELLSRDGADRIEDGRLRSGRKIARAKRSWECARRGRAWTSPPSRCASATSSPIGKVTSRPFGGGSSGYPSQVIDFCEDKGIPIPEDIATKHEKASDVRRSRSSSASSSARRSSRRRRSAIRPSPINALTVTCGGAKTRRSSSGKRAATTKLRSSRAFGRRRRARSGDMGSATSRSPPSSTSTAGRSRCARRVRRPSIPPCSPKSETSSLTYGLPSGGLTVVRKIDGIKPLESASEVRNLGMMLEKIRKHPRHLPR